MPRTPAGGQKKTAQATTKTKGARSTQKDAKPPVPRADKNRLTLVRSLIDQWSEQLRNETTKTGVAELVRLLALEKELAASNESIREIKVTWVEPASTESSKSE